MARSDQPLAATALDGNAAAGCGIADDAHGLVRLLLLLHIDQLVAQIDENLLQLLVLLPLLLVLLLKQLLSLHRFLKLALGHLQVDLQDRTFINGILVH